MSFAKFRRNAVDGIFGGNHYLPTKMARDLDFEDGDGKIPAA